MTPERTTEMRQEEGIDQTAFDERKTQAVEHIYRYDRTRLLGLFGPRKTLDGSPWSDAEQSARLRAMAAQAQREFIERTITRKEPP
jgi:hypothetical protein